MNRDLVPSYAHCQRLARRAATNFYLPLLLLPLPKRRAMYALYAFLRRADDLTDSRAPVEQRQRGLDDWRQSLRHCLEGRVNDPLMPALADTIERYHIPHQYLFDVLDGVEMDLVPRHYETFDQLQHYCHRVASVVGLACIHVWGFTDNRALDPARRCGLAFQLTNILRDLKEDVQRNRIYLPLEDLRRFGYSPDDLGRGLQNEPFRSLMRYQVDRTERLYDEARSLDVYLRADGRRVFRAMFHTYRGLLHEIKRRNGDVFSQRIRLAARTKLRIALHELLVRSPARAGGW